MESGGNANLPTFGDIIGTPGNTPPLHTNAAEADIREYVTRRKISGGERRCRRVSCSRRPRIPVGLQSTALNALWERRLSSQDVLLGIQKLWHLPCYPVHQILFHPLPLSAVLKELLLGSGLWLEGALLDGIADSSPGIQLFAWLQ